MSGLLLLGMQLEASLVVLEQPRLNQNSRGAIPNPTSICPNLSPGIISQPELGGQPQPNLQMQPNLT